jgi:DNA-directed RNA polymerase subunit RPC12/RpoP
MECSKCGKDVTVDDEMLYCPYCSVRLKGEEKRRGILRRELRASDDAKALMVWCLLYGIMAVFLTAFRELVNARLGINVPGLGDSLILVLIAGIASYFTLAYVVYNHAKKRNRRAVAWATAFVVFTPVLGGIAYLLSWPKEKNSGDSS